MRVFSTFTGIGGFEVGIQNAYRATLARSQGNAPENGSVRGGLLASEKQDTSAEGGLPSTGATSQRTLERPLFVGYSEIDKYAIPVYERHYKGVKNYGDITKINAEQLPDFDCLVGGFPCQAFSIAGRRGGFEDTRGTLFFDLARILRAKRPRLFVFENVKGLLSHDNGRTFATIISTIAELGYDAEWQVVNSKNYGVPQNRERIIIVGHLRGTTPPQVFPLCGGNRAIIDPNTEVRDVTQTVTATYYKGGKASHVLVDASYPARDPRVYEKTAPTVRDYGSGGNKMPFIVQTPRGKNKGNVLNVAPTLTGKSYQDNNHASVDGIVRRLTPLECERLQGFPDNWTQLGLVGKRDITLTMPGEAPTAGGMEYLTPMSDSQRYKMCGNAVTTNVIQAVFEAIFDETRTF